MELSGVERASARTGEVCPDGQSDFGRCGAALDEAEWVSWDHVGGPNQSDTDAVQRLERRLYRLQPKTLKDWRWLAERLERAFENGWSEEAIKPLLRLVKAG